MINRLVQRHRGQVSTGIGVCPESAAEDAGDAGDRRGSPNPLSPAVSFFFSILVLFFLWKKF
jgi:hypothetical protein